MNKISLPIGIISTMIDGKNSDTIKVGETFELTITPSLAREWLKTT